MEELAWAHQLKQVMVVQNLGRLWQCQECGALGIPKLLMTSKCRAKVGKDGLREPPLADKRQKRSVSILQQARKVHRLAMKSQHAERAKAKRRTVDAGIRYCEKWKRSKRAQRGPLRRTRC